MRAVLAAVLALASLAPAALALPAPVGGLAGWGVCPLPYAGPVQLAGIPTAPGVWRFEVVSGGCGFGGVVAEGPWDPSRGGCVSQDAGLGTGTVCLSGIPRTHTLTGAELHVCNPANLPLVGGLCSFGIPVQVVRTGI